MDVKEVFKNNTAWIAEKTKDDPEYFVNLAKGQSPGMLYIGCSDSRVTAEGLMGLGPDNVFVHRNVANVVSNMDSNSLAVINYAVEHLKVQHVVVCGHYYCGGVKEAMDHKDLAIINPWLRDIRDVYRLHQTELEGISDETERYKRLVELNVQEQCINLLKNPDVQKAKRSNRPFEIHAWVFDIGTGKLIDLQDPENQKVDVNAAWEGISELYRIDN